MTVRDLLTHTSGLTYHFLSNTKVSDMYADAKILNASVPLGEAIDDLARYPLAFEPGSRWQYSLGIDVAARIIEVISGQALGDFLKQRLFDPLGMVDTAFEVPVDRRERLAAIYGRPDIIAPMTKFSEVFALESAQIGGERGYVIGSLNTGYIRTPAIYAAYRKGQRARAAKRRATGSPTWR